mgnify:CR=1 FL=1
MLAANFSDPENARTIYLAAGGLVVLAGALVAGTVWWWRTSGVEHPVLGPLEVMGTKPFLLADDDELRDIIEAARPGAFDDVLADDELVLRETFDDVFPDGVPVPVAPVAAAPPAAPAAAPLRKRPPARRPEPQPDPQPAAYAPFDDFDDFEPFDDGREEARDADFADHDLDAMADDVWGPAPKDKPAASGFSRPIDPLLKSDDIW